ncbi:hypothetical protein TU94_20870 [Streptomyces cyaneogriseus subsp. noncyanogenus]|uniref:Putative T7SS secretion signal domain-containing protein n=1 Tax=Streptomyces cyaneogriseus subsp. noncyanogenus TaxID=477245 RepID=A0A0C5G0Q6_9ACTN|nr:hypothetical protein [Streptomyces cyaneogriseus]AJP03568.1 hypothetical protein TU94_20870 [Streptomyces cyaneogriseus subsp. noncyanogenus]
MSAQDYPSLGFDPAPGKLESVDDLTVKLAKAVTCLESAHATVAAIGKGGKTWEGRAADAFAEKVGDLPKYLGDSRDALRSAEAQLKTWHAKLADYQEKARQYEAQAKSAKEKEKAGQSAHDKAADAYNQAAADPAFRLSGLYYANQADLENAQAKIDAASLRLKQAGNELDAATQRLNAARDEFEGILKKAEELLEHHQSDARAIADRLAKANGRAPDPGLFEGLADAFTRLGHNIQNWCTKHADLLNKIGDWLSIASAVMGVASLLTLWCPPLAGAFALAGGALSLGALAAHGGAKLGGADVSMMDLAGDALGVVPLGKLGQVAWKGTKVAMKVSKNGVKMIDRVNKIEGLERAGFQGGPPAGKRYVGLFGEWEAGSRHFKASGIGDRVKLAWKSHVLDTAGASIKEQGLSKVIEWSPKSVKESLQSAIRADGTLDPMSWWSRGAQIATQAPSIGWSMYTGLTGSDTPSAGRL